jgi:hypothetical protein
MIPKSLPALGPDHVLKTLEHDPRKVQRLFGSDHAARSKTSEHDPKRLKTFRMIMLKNVARDAASRPQRASEAR